MRTIFEHLLNLLSDRRTWIALLIPMLLGAGCQSTPQPVEETSIPTLVITITPGITETEVPPTNTPVPPTDTPLPTQTETVTASSIPTDTPTDTPTPIPPELTFIQNGVCYTGPGWNYDVVEYFLPGITVPIIGQNEDQSWWTIRVPETDEECWTINSGIESSGEYAVVSILDTPPPPTAAPSETPEQIGVKYYLIDMNSPGPFGCGERMVYIYIGTNYSGTIENKIKQAPDGSLQSDG